MKTSLQYGQFQIHNKLSILKKRKVINKMDEQYQSIFTAALPCLNDSDMALFYKWFL